MEEYYTPEEVAEKLKVTRQAVYNWIARGKLRAVRAERVVRIPRGALEEFLRPVDPEQGKAAA